MVNGNIPTSLSRDRSDAWNRTDRARGQRVVLGSGGVGVGVDGEISTLLSSPELPCLEDQPLLIANVTHYESHCFCYNPAAVKMR